MPFILMGPGQYWHAPIASCDYNYSCKVSTHEKCPVTINKAVHPFCLCWSLRYSSQSSPNVFPTAPGTAPCITGPNSNSTSSATCLWNVTTAKTRKTVSSRDATEIQYVTHRGKIAKSLTRSRGSPPLETATFTSDPSAT